MRVLGDGILEPTQWSAEGGKGKDVFEELQEGKDQELEH